VSEYAHDGTATRCYYHFDHDGMESMLERGYFTCETDLHKLVPISPLSVS
jgi:hypothetical protein